MKNIINDKVRFILLLLFAFNFQAVIYGNLVETTPKKIFKGDQVQLNVEYKDGRRITPFAEIHLPSDINDQEKVWLTYEYKGVKDPYSLCFSINDAHSRGGILVSKDSVWYEARERISGKLLKSGKNKLRFSALAGNHIPYQIRNVSIEIEEQPLVNSDPVFHFQYLVSFDDSSVYVKGFVGQDIEKILIENKEFEIDSYGEFEGILTSKNNVLAIELVDVKGKSGYETWEVEKGHSTYNYVGEFRTKTNKVENFRRGLADVLMIDKAGIILDSLSLESEEIEIRVSELLSQDLSGLERDMANVTGGTISGYRFLPHGEHFTQYGATLSIPYDVALIPSGYTEDDIRTFYFDEQHQKWTQLEVDSLDKVNKVVYTRITHFSDYINGIIKGPDGPQTAGFVPTEFMDLPKVLPTSGVQIIDAPSANNMGDANLQYPIVVPPGRQGIQPNLSITYNSGGGDGWLGVGWDLSVPGIEVETKWGVPRYSDRHESETYLFQGEQLIQIINNSEYLPHRSQWKDRRNGKVQFYKRRNHGGGYDRIERMGNSPSNYTWVVTSPNGIKSYYGSTSNSTLTTPSGSRVTWKLDKVEDMYGNYMTYEYNQTTLNLGEDTNPLNAHGLYLSKIEYTANVGVMPSYMVDFSIEVKQNKTFSARTGAMIANRSLLHEIRVSQLNGTLVRKYELEYGVGEFRKMLLTSIKQFGSDGVQIGENNFEYEKLEKVGSEKNCYEGEKTWVLRDQGITTSKFISEGENEYAAKIVNMSGIGGGLSNGWGLTTYAGVGSPGGVGKTNTLGIQYSLSSSSSYGKVQMIDINGDGLPDKVFKDEDGKIAYCPNESRSIDGKNYSGMTNDLNIYFGEKIVISTNDDFSDFSFTKTISNSFGPQATIDGANLQNPYTISTTKVKTYFTDVNGDGLVDIIDNGIVYFNKYKEPNVSHDFEPKLPSELKKNSLDGSVMIVESLKDEICENPLGDVVKMWKAPYTGTITISGIAQHVGAEFYDGVKLMIEHGKIQTMSTSLLEPHILNEANPSKIINRTIQINKGDYLFFRISSGDDNSTNKVIADGREDIISFIPKISYGLLGTNDSYDLPRNEFEYSTDFVQSQTKTNTLVLEDVNHSILIDGEINLTEDLCGPVELVMEAKPSWILDDLTVVEGQTITQSIGIYQNQSQTELPSGLIISNLGIPSTGISSHGIEINFELRSVNHTNLAWQSIKTDIDIKNYQTGDALIENAGVDYMYYNENIYDSNVEFGYVDLNDLDEVRFNEQIMTESSKETLKNTSSTFFLVKGSDNCNREIVSFEGEIDGQGELSFTFSNLPLFEIQGVSSSYYILIVDNPSWARKINNAEILINDGTSHKITVWSINSLEKLNLGNMYRNWGTFVYKPKDLEADLTIDLQEVMDVVDPQALSLKYEDVYNQEPTMRNCDYRISSMTLSRVGDDSSAEYRWQLGKDIFASKTVSKSSRIGQTHIEVALKTNDGEVYSAPTIKSRTISATLYGGTNIGLFDVSSGLGFGNKVGVVNYRDLNGDRIPDVVFSEDVQYSFPTGELELAKKIHKTMHTNLSIFANSIGGSVRYPQENNKEAQAGENASKLGFGILDLSLKDPQVVNSDKVFLIDLNGDGLDDIVKFDPLGNTIRYNIGTGFSKTVDFQFGNPNFFRHKNYSKDLLLKPNIGFSLYNGSYKGGLGMNGSSSYSEKQFIDFNNDGLIDFISEDGTVFINNGETFLDYGVNDLPKFENLLMDRTQISKTYMQGWAANFAFTGDVVIYGAKVALTFGANTNLGMSRDEFRFQDIDGDGYPDFLNARPESVDLGEVYSDSFLKVRRSKIGAVNRLKKITGAFGHEVDIEYAMSAATFNHPNGKWVMSKVTIDDKVAMDGPNIVTQYNYMEGKYDRYEREFLGFGKVIITEGGNYRRTVQNYYTDFAKRSMLKESLVGVPVTGSIDGVDMTKMYNRVVQEVNTTRVEPMAGNTYVRGTTPITDFKNNMLLNTVDRVTKRFFEGTSNGTVEYIGSDASMVYDAYGNLKDYMYSNDGALVTASNKRYQTTIVYDYDNTNNVLSLPTSVNVTGVNGAVRNTMAIIEPGKNKYKEISSGSIKTEYTYDTYGNLQKITLPSDEDGNRPEYTYTYESVHNTYVEMIKDHFGLESKMLGYNDYGTYEEKIDFNGNSIKYTYDAWGRLEEILGPKELADNVPYTVKYTYDITSSHPNSKMERYDPQNSGNDIVTILYCDKLGRVVQTVTDADISTDPNVAPVQQYVKSGLVKYDNLGRVESTYFPIVGGASGIDLSQVGGIQSTVSYDVLDRPINQTNMGVETEFEYGFGKDNEEVDRFKTTVTTLNQAGTTGLNLVVTNYSKIGNIPTLTESSIIYSGETPELQQTSYEYDGFEQLIKVIAPNQGETTYEYDQHGRVVLKIMPETNESYTYDNLGQITSRNRAGQTTDYVYDRNRLMEVKYPSLNHNNIEFVYGTSDDGVISRRGRLIMRKDAVGYHEFSYGNMGEVVKERNTYAIPFIATGVTFETEYEYDSWNRVQKITYPDGEIVSYHYDRGGNLNRIEGEKENIIYKYVDQIGYDKFGQKTFMKCGDFNGQSGITTSYSYENGTRRLVNLISKNGQGQAFQDLNYLYDNIGNILRFRNDAGVVGSTNLGGSSINHYKYDSHSRLRTADGTWTGGNVPSPSGGTVTRSGNYSIEMKYDVVGNILEKNQSVTRINEHFPFGITKERAMVYNYPTGSGNVKRNQIKGITEDFEETIGASNPNDLEKITLQKNHDYVYDIKGNINIVEKEHVQEGVNDLRFEREVSNNHENLIEVVNDDGLYSHYFYDGNATRRLKILPKRTKIWTNGALSGNFFEEMRFTLYVNPLMVVRSGNHYTKHIYANGEMLVSKIGDNSTYDNGKDPVSLYNEIKTEEQMNGFGAKVGILENQIVGIYDNPDNIYQYKSSIIHQAYEATGCSGDEECHSYYYSKNHLGSSTYITDKEGEVLQHIEYLPFGENFVEYRSTNYGTPYKFTGKEQDCETGLYYYGARYYDPSIGVFMSVDPLADKFPSWSPYVYTLNNPINMIDPDGRAPKWYPRVMYGRIELVKEGGDNLVTLNDYFRGSTRFSPQQIKNAYNNAKRGTLVTLPQDNYSKALKYSQDNAEEFPTRKEVSNMTWEESRKVSNYNCYHLCVNGAWEKDIYSFWGSYGPYVMGPEQFQNVLNNYFTKVNPEDAIYGETIITMNYSGGLPQHSAIYGGTDNDGNIYIIEKYGDKEAPSIRKLDETGYDDYQFYNEKQ